MQKKRPDGEEMRQWQVAWDEGDHADKVALCKKYGIGYETGRHWRSDSGPAPKEPSNRMSLAELLGSRPAVNLDFVCFDIETSNLRADFSIMLSACIKPYGQKPIVFRADDYPSWTEDRSDDCQITKAIAVELRQHAIVIGHYSQKFDIPFIRAKMLKHGLDPLPPMFGIDTWRIAKNNFAVSSRRLKNLANYFDVGDKEGVDGDLWLKAAFNGDKKAMDAIVEHNIIDVEVLEKLACISFPFLKSMPKL